MPSAIDNREDGRSGSTPLDPGVLFFIYEEESSHHNCRYISFEKLGEEEVKPAGIKSTAAI